MKTKMVLVSLVFVLFFSMTFISPTGYFGLTQETTYVEKNWHYLATPNLANPNIEFEVQELKLIEVDN